MIVFAIEHLCVLAEDVAIPVDFREYFGDEFLVHWTLGSGVVVERGIPALEQLRDSHMVTVGQLLRSDSLANCFDLDGCSVLV